MAHNRAMADGTHPHFGKCVALGHETARQIEHRSGPIYERWRKAMRGYVATIEAACADE
jgi:hypothetical protein